MAVLAIARVLVDVERLGAAMALGMLWRGRIGEWRGQKHHTSFLQSYFFLPQSLRTFSSVAKFVFSSGVYCCRSLLRSGPGSRGSPGGWCILLGQRVPCSNLGRPWSCSLNPVWFHGCNVCAPQPREHLCSYFWMWVFTQVWILCQSRNYTSYFKIPLLVKWIFHLYSEQLPLS